MPENKIPPRVSILMPCFDAADTLEETLHSLAAQTMPNFEVIAVDDGSTDETPRILEHWSRADRRFRLVSRPHGGIISALNQGLEACSAAYIARIDADDLAAPTRLEKQAAFLDAHPETALVSCRTDGFPPDDVREGFRLYLDWLNNLLTHEVLTREIFVESPFPHPSVMVRRAWLARMGGYEEHSWPEDYDLWLRMYLAGARFAKLPDTLLQWREHPDRLTRTDNRYSLENFIRAKAHYLVRGPVRDRDAVIIWGAGMMGKRISKHLIRAGAPLVAFVDIDPKKIGRTRRNRPIIPPEQLPVTWKNFTNPIILAAVGARGARILIRERLTSFGFEEGRDWLGVA